MINRPIVPMPHSTDLHRAVQRCSACPDSIRLDDALSRSGLHSIPTEITQVQETITFFFVTRVAVVPAHRTREGAKATAAACHR